MKDKDNMLEVEMNKFTKEDQVLLYSGQHPEYLYHPFKNVAISRVRLEKGAKTI